MNSLNGSQRKFLRGFAHKLKPVVLVGQKGLSEALFQSVDEALGRHELIKVKFIDMKEKQQKTAVAEALVHRTGCEMVGMVGHTAIFFRQNPDPEKRRVVVPGLNGQT